MIVIPILAAWWLLLAVFAWALCRSGANADRVAAEWARERVRTGQALALLGDDADGLWS